MCACVWCVCVRACVCMYIHSSMVWDKSNQNPRTQGTQNFPHTYVSTYVPHKHSIPQGVLTISTPKDHQSAVVPCPLRLTTSGAMYSTVPQNEKVFLFSSSMDSLLRPKSVNLMCPSSSRRMLSAEEQKVPFHNDIKSMTSLLTANLHMHILFM